MRRKRRKRYEHVKKHSSGTGTVRLELGPKACACVWPSMKNTECVAFGMVCAAGTGVSRVLESIVQPKRPGLCTSLLCEHVFTVQREPLEDVLTPDQTLELAIVDHR